MYKHIVAFKLKDANDAPAMKATLMRLRDEPQVRHWEVGINSGPSGQPYEVVIYSEFDSRADLLAFRDGVLHNEVKHAIAGYFTTSGTIDYDPAD